MTARISTSVSPSESGISYSLWKLDADDLCLSSCIGFGGSVASTGEAAAADAPSKAAEPAKEASKPVQEDKPAKEDKPAPAAPIQVDVEVKPVEQKENKPEPAKEQSKPEQPKQEQPKQEQPKPQENGGGAKKDFHGHATYYYQVSCLRSTAENRPS